MPSVKLAGPSQGLDDTLSAPDTASGAEGKLRRLKRIIARPQDELSQWLVAATAILFDTVIVPFAAIDSNDTYCSVRDDNELFRSHANVQAMVPVLRGLCFLNFPKTLSLSSDRGHEFVTRSKKGCSC